MAEGNHWNKSLISKAKMTGSYSSRDLIMNYGRMGFSELCWFAHRQRPTKESQSKGSMPWNDDNLEQEIKWYLIVLRFNQTIHTERNCVIKCQSSLLRKVSWSTEQFIEYTDIFCLHEYMEQIRFPLKSPKTFLVNLPMAILFCVFPPKLSMLVLPFNLKCESLRTITGASILAVTLSRNFSF